MSKTREEAISPECNAVVITSRRFLAADAAPDLLGFFGCRRPAGPLDELAEDRVDPLAEQLLGVGAAEPSLAQPTAPGSCVDGSICCRGGSGGRGVTSVTGVAVGEFKFRTHGTAGASRRSSRKLATVRRWCSSTDRPVRTTLAGSHIQSWMPAACVQIVVYGEPECPLGPRVPRRRL